MTLEALVRGTRAARTLTFTRCGGLTFQLRGVPSRGRVSKAIAELVMTAAEQRILSERPGLRAELAVARYVDDAVLATTSWCAPCVRALRLQIHEGYEIKVAEGPRPLRWLDVLVRANEGAVQLAPVPWVAVAPGGKRPRIAAWRGVPPESFATSRGKIICRLLRLTALLGPKESRQLAEAELEEWIRAGFPRPYLRKVVGSLPWWPPDDGALRRSSFTMLQPVPFDVPCCLLACCQGVVGGGGAGLWRHARRTANMAPPLGLSTASPGTTTADDTERTDVEADGGRRAAQPSTAVGGGPGSALTRRGAGQTGG